MDLLGPRTFYLAVFAVTYGLNKKMSGAVEGYFWPLLLIIVIHLFFYDLDIIWFTGPAQTH
jgi:hypothetical protein